MANELILFNGREVAEWAQYHILGCFFRICYFQEIRPENIFPALLGVSDYYGYVNRKI